MTRPFISGLCVTLKSILPAALLLASLGLAPAARADFTWDFVQDLNNQTVTTAYTGSWNFNSTDNTSAFGPVDSVGYNTHGWLVLHGSVNPVSGYAFSGLSGALPWSLSGSQMLPTPAQISGSDWGIFYGYAYGPESFTNSTVISGSYLWSHTTLADLSISGPGGTFSGGGTPIVWTASTVPEPATYGALLGLGCLVVARARRRN